MKHTHTHTHTHTHIYTHTHSFPQAGLRYPQLLSTVGIHPTNAEVLTEGLPSKSSGTPAAKAGC